METKEIHHKGEIVKIDGRRITVSMLSQGGCGSCQARGKCGMVESERREVEVFAREGKIYSVGDSVTVSVAMSIGQEAVVLAYVVPLVLMIVLMVVGGVLHLAEWGVAAVGLGGVALYYCVLYFLRDKIERRINFTIT
ncbi:MAG: SoxR reducing system RseC family protein [Rikenellaceae bacterium]